MKPTSKNWIKYFCLKYISEPLLYSLKHFNELMFFNLQMIGGVSPLNYREVCVGRRQI